ncbi:MAG: YebC/PmpR family DNA-binding transcriptional regulator, partial [Kiritimatiellae bacterium]|nr:YebC/PmpR family DNA-binding transcriptional regulator [Kiritimatiellia bacterium]
EIRHVFTRHDSSLAAEGSVTRNFQRKGQIIVDASKVDEDKLLAIVLEAGAEDMQRDNGHFEILTDPSVFNNVTAALEKAGIEMLSAEVSLIPTTLVPVSREVARAAMKFIADLEECEDVQNVYTNMDISEEILKELEQEEKSAVRKS